MSVRWLDKLEEEWSVKETEASTQESRIVALEAQVADLTEWLTAVAEDLLERTTPSGERMLSPTYQAEDTGRA